MEEFHKEYESRLKMSPGSPETSPIKRPEPYFSPLQKSALKSPKKEIYGDRFIPTRSSSNLQRNLFGTMEESNQTTKRTEVNSTYNLILKNELLGQHDPSPTKSKSKSITNNSPSEQQENLLKYKTSKYVEKSTSPYSLTPMSDESQKLLSSPRKPTRKISKEPFKVLEAPAIQDDFYLNLVDWSSQNVLAVGLGNSVYLWNACTSHVTKLCDVGDSDSITSVNWIQRGTHLAVGTNLGSVQIWDVAHCKKIRDMGGHKSRVGALAWNAHLLSSGSRDHMVLNRDVRVAQAFCSKLVGHNQEVCGLKWSYDNQFLASGGNDNKLFIWDAATSSRLVKFSDHIAAVKAIAWSPHQRGLLASGGGTADRCIRFWNAINCKPISSIDTGSQVCNLAWSKNVNELVSTHGYSQNQVVVWTYPSMTQVATLTGHTMRVLYLAVSPDGQTIVTGAGDETLRFWNVFPSDLKSISSGISNNSLYSRNDIR